MDETMRRRDLLAAATALSAAPFVGLRAEAPPRRYTVRTVEPAWIEVAGGVNLAARLWIPQGAVADRCPVVFEYIPYRTHDSYRFLDDRWGRQLASQGIAFARVDIRGSGNSEGVLEDEYLPIEQEDGVQIIAWLARQSWCNGAVGMRGLSWGGFSTLQVAALAPPELKAIMPMCATDMRFWDDAHYVGGAPGLTNLKWAAGFEMVMTGPPDPEIVGDRWETMWRRRLEATPSIAARWLEHQSNDAYWRHGSVGIDYGAIKCPVYIVDGWSDSYAESAERLLGGIKTPKKALFGPWGHIYPDLARPGPGLDWAFEELRWWRRWLLGEETGVMQGPVFRYYMPYATPAETRMADLPGRWASEPLWPSPNIEAQALFLAEGALQTTPPAPKALIYLADQVVGLAKPEWIPYAVAELPTDQRRDDARSLVFDMPVAAPLEIVGVPILTVKVSSDRPIAKLAARLSEVTPDGASWLVTTGVLDLAFRDGPLAGPSRLTPGQVYQVDLKLAVIAHRFKAGSSIRLALSESLWPLVWPSPEVVTLSLQLGESRLALPVRPIPAAEAPFPIPITHPTFSRGEPVLKINDAGGPVTVDGAWPASSNTVAATGETLSGSGPDMTLSFDPRHPNRSRWTVSQTSRFRRSEWDCETQVEIEMTSTARAFRIRERLKAHKDGKLIFERRRVAAIPRRFS